MSPAAIDAILAEFTGSTAAPRRRFAGKNGVRFQRTGEG